MQFRLRYYRDAATMQRAKSLLQPLFVLAGMLFLALRFVHPTADFPSGSPWVDEAGRYTDEGWYASGALHKALLGHWLVAGDFNPVVLLPAWPALLALLFHVTGVSMPAARLLDAAFGVVVILLATLLVRRHQTNYASMSLLLLGTSPILFFFSRLALLEVPMLAFFLAAVFVAPRAEKHSIGRTIAAALLFCAAVLVKSSALFLLPALLSYVWMENRREDERRARRLCWLMLLVTMLTMSTFAAAVLLPRLAEVRALGQQNGMTLQWRSAEKLARVLYRGATWVSPVLFPLALVSLAGSAGPLRSLWQRPLFCLSALWMAGYAGFCVLHFSADPRYFTVFVVPVVFLAVLLMNELHQLGFQKVWWSGAALIGVALLGDAASIGRLLHSPAYTLRDACMAMAVQIRASGDPHPLVFGHGAVESTMFTQIPAIDDMGSMPLDRKLELYRPGWIVTWSDGAGVVEMPAIQRRFRPVLTGSWAVMDQPGRSHLMLYRLQVRR